MAVIKPVEILTVDLSSGKSVRSQVKDPEFIKKYVGGRGIALHFLLSNLDPEIDPYAPEAPIIFAPGVLTGTFVPSSGRTSVLFKSPATGRIFKTNVGGHFGAQLKFAGYDMLVVKGRAEKPVYVYIEDDSVEIRTLPTFGAKMSGNQQAGTGRIRRPRNTDGLHWSRRGKQGCLCFHPGFNI